MVMTWRGVELKFKGGGLAARGVVTENGGRCARAGRTDVWAEVGGDGRGAETAGGVGVAGLLMV
jgi:hypothetical protein